MSVDGISAVPQLQNLQSSPGGELLKKTYEKAASSSSKSGKDEVQIQISIPRQTLDTLQSIGNITDVLNDTAKSLRASNSGVSAADAIAAKMRSTLEKITKNYPPFPIDSAERRDILMSYRALQKEMEKMMVPAPPTPVYEKVQSLWTDLFGKGGTGTISTPNLPENASDAAVTDAAKQITGTGAAISTLQTAISSIL